MSKKISELIEKLTVLGVNDELAVVTEGVLKKIKASLIESPLKAYSDAAVASEALIRSAADTANSDAISAETLARTNADALNAGAIATESSDRAVEDLLLQQAIDAEVLARENAIAQEVVDRNAAVAAIVNSAPSTLDTLNELSAALANDPNFATTTATSLGNRLRVDINSQGLTAPQKVNGKTNLGLENVDNTSDANKPVSIATQSALDLKASITYVNNAVAVPASSLIATNVDWSLSETFYKDILADITITFSNVVEGKGLSLVLTNTSGAPVTVTVPSCYRVVGALTIPAGEAAIYTFMRINAKTYMAVMPSLVLVV